MNIFNVVADASAVLKQGQALKWSTILTNTEAGAAMLYAFLASVVSLLNALGVDLHIGGTDLHTVASGWSITISALYSVYRVATNPAAGIANETDQ